MKKLLYILVVFCSFSCEEVVDLELETAPPRLVIEASLLMSSESKTNLQTIKLSTTAPYFEEAIPPVTGAIVSITAGTGEEYIFSDEGDGIYQNDQIELQENLDYHLEIIHKEEVYTATEQLITTTNLQFVEQERGGFSGDEFEFRIYYEDPEEEENYYLFKYFNEQISLQIYDDSFTNGNQTFAFFSDEDAAPGDRVLFEIQGISAGFYNYLFTLRSQSGDNNGGPFQTQPSVVRGNVVNQTKPDNFPFGYFRVSEVDILAYEVE